MGNGEYKIDLSQRREFCHYSFVPNCRAGMGGGGVSNCKFWREKKPQVHLLLQENDL